ncbi:MAG: MaoC/PaaZ C-terminal domain-containing protein [Archaeoglobaceae archaeon]|nr:MaoC/PaaZ C-terminal domain-containing protein [Archaeoglobaceae archaeon]MCX8152289.1 MaoC/PaaZ C-terminal domain-containing protein [Archaeoglobaceae archaeon]MDW8013967.1 MaoC/PaaZ C-terminal domain-containing protein [Archaeoglobaceae archaeon]
MVDREVELIYSKLGGELKDFKKFEGEVDVGYRIVYEKKIEDVDVKFFGLVSGDLNPVHFDDSFASKTRFGGRVVHGMLTTSLVSAAVARIPGTIVLLENFFKYTSPVRPGDLVKVEGVVVEKDRNRFKIDVKCLVKDKVVAEGYVKILIW